MDHVPDLVVRRWVRGSPHGHDRQELQIRRRAGQWRLRRIGQVHRPDIPCRDEEEALRLAARLRAGRDDWREQPADMSPPIRYGGPGQWSDRPPAG